MQQCLTKVPGSQHMVSMLLARTPGWIAFFAYFLTLAPTVTLEWSGMLVTAADHGGVPIPPGYPLWTILAVLFARAFSWVTFNGHPNPAWGVGLMSAVFGALTVANVAALVRRVHTREDSDRLPAAVAGASASLILAFSHTFWTKCVVAEPVTLYLFLLTLFLRLGLKWIQEGRAAEAYALAVVCGLGVLTSYAFGVVLLILPFLVIAAGRDAIRRLHPAVLLMCFVAGLLPVLYLPIASAQNPPMNWGYARSWEGFLHVIRRGQFERIDVTANAADFMAHPEKVSRLISVVLHHLLAQFRLPLILVALAGSIVAGIKPDIRRTWHLLLGLLFVAYIVAILLVQNPLLDIQTLFIARIAWLPLSVLTALFIGTALFSYTRQLLSPRPTTPAP